MSFINNGLLTASLIAMVQTPVSYYRTVKPIKTNKSLDFDNMKAAEEKRKRKQLRNIKNKTCNSMAR